MATLNKITPNLWFSSNVEEAIAFYTSIFARSSIGKKTYYGKEGYDIHQMPEGKLMTAEFELEGQSFMALNGGPIFKFNEAVSFVIHCGPQEEIDYYWDKLSEGGDPNAQQCGWLKDKFGLSWQVVPEILGELLADEDPEKAGRVMNAMMQMKKIDIETLKRAYDKALFT